MTRRTSDAATIRISRRSLAVGGALALAVLILAVLLGLGSLVRANEPRATATTAQLSLQQGAVERDIERAYEQATDQVKKVRALNLAIGAPQADQIATKAYGDLFTLRHNAFVSLGQVLGLIANEAESYATSTEQRFDKAPVSAGPSPTPVLLAPRFYTIVSRMSELATALADQATTALTAPAPTGTPTSTPTARPSGSPSPSPSR
jgi:hypothetical protein